MDISSFMVVIVFCFLLFMDNVPPEAADRHKLGLDLGDLHRRLDKLRLYDNKRIDSLLQEVAKARGDNSVALSQRLPIRGGRQMSSQVGEVQLDIDRFIRSSHSNDELIKFLDGIEKKLGPILQQIRDL